MLNNLLYNNSLSLYPLRTDWVDQVRHGLQKVHCPFLEMDSQTLWWACLFKTVSYTEIMEKILKSLYDCLSCEINNNKKLLIISLKLIIWWHKDIINIDKKESVTNFAQL